LFHIDVLKKSPIIINPNSFRYAPYSSAVPRVLNP